MRLTTKRLKQLIREELSRMNERNEDMRKGEGRLQQALQNLDRINLARGTGDYTTVVDKKNNYIEVMVDGKTVAYVYNNGSVQIDGDPELEAEFNKSATT